jgi:hypothetical protein
MSLAKRLIREYEYQQRLEERIARVIEDFCWAVFREAEAIRAQEHFLARGGEMHSVAVMSVRGGEPGMRPPLSLAPPADNV